MELRGPARSEARAPVRLLQARRRVSRRPLLAAFLLIVLPSSFAAADELRLANGDRYTGTAVQLSGGTLTFKTAHGTLAVPWAQVGTLTVDESIVATSAGGDEVTLPEGGSINIANTVALTRPQPPFEISGGAGAGILETGGNTSVNSLRLDADAMVRMRANRYTFGADVNRAEDRGVTTARNWTTSARYDRFLTQRLFVNGNAIFTNDRFRDLDLRGAYGAGIGYQVLQGPAIKLSVDGGVGYVREDFDVAADDSYAAVRESGMLDLVLVPDRVVLFHRHDGYFGVTGEDNLFMQAKTGVRVSIAAGFVTTVRVDVDYDRSPAPGRENVDRTFAVTLGYRF